MQPSVKDTAEFYAQALSYGLADCQEVLRWGDKLVEREAKPASWLIDLALVKENSPADTIATLHSAPGVIAGFIPTKMLLLRAKKLFKQGKFGGERIGQLLVELLKLQLLPSEFVADAYRIDDGFDLATSHTWPREAADAALHEFLDKLTIFEDLEIVEP
jgi:hypothetical protein